MPDSSDIAEPVGNTTEMDRQSDNETAAEYLATQASPAIVELAEHVHQAFLTSLQSKLATALGCDTRTAFIRTEQSLLARYLTDAEPGIHKVVLSLEPLAGCAILRFSSELLFRTLDILLASPAEAVGSRTEFLTEIEFHLLRGFFRVFEDVLRETWRAIPGIALTPLAGLSEEIIGAYGESQALAMKSTLEIDDAKGDFDVVIPAFLARLSARPEPTAEETIVPDQNGPARITEALGAARVELEAVLSDLAIRIGDLAELAPGQILLTEKSAESGFECLVNQRSFFKGELVAAGDRYGFQLGALEGKAAEPAPDR